jgi:hypothetical protein
MEVNNGKNGRGFFCERIARAVAGIRHEWGLFRECLRQASSSCRSGRCRRSGTRGRRPGENHPETLHDKTLHERNL